jgi:hypothetical protein
MFTRNIWQGVQTMQSLSHNRRIIAHGIAIRLFSEATIPKSSPSGVKILFGSQTGKTGQKKGRLGQYDD